MRKSPISLSLLVFLLVLSKPLFAEVAGSPTLTVPAHSIDGNYSVQLDTSTLQLTDGWTLSTNDYIFQYSSDGSTWQTYPGNDARTSYTFNSLPVGIYQYRINLKFYYSCGFGACNETRLYTFSDTTNVNPVPPPTQTPTPTPTPTPAPIPTDNPAPIKTANFSAVSHDVYIGDVNDDGFKDIYLKARPIVLLISGQINIPILIDPIEQSYLIIYNADEQYQFNNAIVVAQHEQSLEGWALGVIGDVRDTNGDGVNDIYIAKQLGLAASLVVSGKTIQTLFNQKIKPGEVIYKYDALGRLILANDNLNPARVYEYDPAGNRQQVTTD